MTILLFFLELLLLFSVSQFLTRSISKLLFHVTKSKNITIYFLSFLFLPGVVIHELSHLITASLLFIQVSDIEFFPKIQEGGVKLGSVSIGQSDPFRRALIGISPLVFGAGIMIASIFYIFEASSFPSVWRYIVTVYLVFEIGNTMFSSRKDLEGFLEVLLTILFLSVVLLLVGFKIPDLTFLSSLRVLEFFKKGSLILLIPLGIDLLAIILSNWVSKILKN